MSSSFRRQLELRAGPVVVLLARLPRVVPFLVVLGLLVAGLLVGGAVGALLLGVLALLMALLLLLGWPALEPQGRLLRALVVAVVAVRAVSLLL
jgi:hypothetical protein